MKQKISVGAVIAKPEYNTSEVLSELKKYLATPKVDLLLFPEGYIHSDNLKDVAEIVKGNGKWLVCGMDDYRKTGEKHETAVVINPKGEIVGEHQKTSLTSGELEKGYSNGNRIEPINTEFGKIGICICYEIHFPEIARVHALKGARVIFNPIGTGMWNEKQYRQWNSVAQTRASENKAYVVGCSHFNDTIPIAFAYDPDSECIVQARDCNRLVKINIDLERFPIEKYNNFKQRRPELYGVIVKKLK